MVWRRSRLPLSSLGPRLAAGLAILVLAGACAETVPEPVAPRAPAAQRPYLLPPASGYPGSLDPELERSVGDLHRRLLAEGAGGELRRLIDALARERSEAAPVQVLTAQAEVVGGDPERARQRLEAVVGQWPEYDAAALLLGRLHERAGDLPQAFAAYRNVAERVPLAAERMVEIRPRALEIVSNRLAGALTAGDLEMAGQQLERLETWAPDATPTLEGARRLAQARGDAPSELATVRELRRRLPEDAELRDRLATLEVSVGDPGAGISILQEMAAERPGDPDLARRLSRARFRWRMVLLPSEVRQVTGSPELTRSELAALMYWLFPTVRYARPEGARIANDVFDHPFREEIVRVINLDLMGVDPGLHEFGPAEPATRVEALGAVLRVLATAVPDEPCLGAVASRTRLSWPLACAGAAACGLIEAEADCLPAASISGREAVELCRRGQLLLGGE